MNRTPWITYLWPGATQLWRHGAWSSLLLAVVFGLGLNLALLSTLVWSELFSPIIRNSTWLVVVVSWAGFALFSRHWNHHELVSSESRTSDDQFAAALDHYLQGDWFEAQRILTALIRRNARDVDARLMLATLLRHTRRFDEAAQHLAFLQRLEDAGKWELEICREWELLQQARSAGDQPEADAAPLPSGNAAAETIPSAA